MKLKMKGILAVLGVWGFLALLIFAPEVALIIILGLTLLLGSIVIYAMAIDESD